MSNLWVIPEELGDYADSEYAYEACKTASYLMWAMSGRKFSGINTITERYLPLHRTTDRNERYNMNQTRWGSSGPLPFNERVPLIALRLRGLPVISIESIHTADDVLVEKTDYELIDKTWVRFKRAFAQGVTVNYIYGVQPPIAGRMAARHLAIQFAKLWSGADDCELPERVTSISRQGISMTLLDNQDFIDDLKTGVYNVDLFLKSVNPDAARNRSKVFSADIPRGSRVQKGTTFSARMQNGWQLVSDEDNAL